MYVGAAARSAGGCRASRSISGRAGELAAEHLLELGHRRVAAIVGSKASGIHAARYEGFVDALRAAGVKVPRARVRHAPDTIEGGYAAARDLLQADPALTAIFLDQ